MIFTFSPYISTARKVVYVGVMLTVSAIILSSILGSWSEDGFIIGAPAYICAIGGLSLIGLPWLYKKTLKTYGDRRLISMSFVSFTPVIMHVFMYVIADTASSVGVNSQALMYYSNWVVLFDIPFTIAAVILIDRGLSHAS